jgi:hypothetical protein
MVSKIESFGIADFAKLMEGEKLGRHETGERKRTLTIKGLT